MIETVLDSSAVLADIHNEPGAEAVRVAIPNACISAVNFAEVITKLVEAGLPDFEIRSIAEQLRLKVEPADQATATQVGMLHAKTRGTGVSLGDRFCLVLAEQMGLPVLTSDRRWAQLDLGVDIRLIR